MPQPRHLEVMGEILADMAVDTLERPATGYHGNKSRCRPARTSISTGVSPPKSPSTS